MFYTITSLNIIYGLKTQSIDYIIRKGVNEV